MEAPEAQRKRPAAEDAARATAEVLSRGAGGPVEVQAAAAGAGCSGPTAVPVPFLGCGQRRAVTSVGWSGRGFPSE